MSIGLILQLLLLGNFGTCLAYHLANIEHKVTIYARDPKVVDSINTHHKNSKYLSDVVLPPNLNAISKLDAAIASSYDVCLFFLLLNHLI